MRHIIILAKSSELLGASFESNFVTLQSTYTMDSSNLVYPSKLHI